MVPGLGGVMFIIIVTTILLLLIFLITFMTYARISSKINECNERCKKYIATLKY